MYFGKVPFFACFFYANGKFRSFSGLWAKSVSSLWSLPNASKYMGEINEKMRKKHNTYW